MKTPTVQAEPYCMTPYSDVHDKLTVEWLNRPDIVASFGISRSVTKESHRRWVDSSEGVLIWAVVDKKSAHCANVLLHLNDRNRSGYFQIYVGNPAWRGQGIGTAVLRATLTTGFGQLGLHRIWLHTLQGNEAAENLYRKAGFVCEGKERDAVLRDGKFYHQLRWSIFEREWNKQQSSKLT